MDLSGIFGDTSGFFAQLQDAHNEVVGSLNIPSWDEVMGDDAPSMLADLWKFVDAVDWRNEPFFKYLAGFYAVLVIVFVWSLTTVDRTVGMTVVLVALGLSTTFLNTLGEQYGGEYLFVGKGVNYFEPSGIFVSVVFGLPLLLLLFVATGRVLLGVCRLMVDKKVHQMKQAHREENMVAAVTRPTGESDVTVNAPSKKAKSPESTKARKKSKKQE